MDAVETTSKTAQSMRGFVLLAVGFGCMIGYVRLVSLGFVGYLEQGVIESVDPYYSLRSVVTVVLLVVLALAGWFKWFKLNAMALMGATACAVAAAMLFAVDDSGAVLPAAAVLEGLASAVFMYAWMLVLSRQAVGTIVGACVAGGCLAGFIISVVLLFDDALGLVIAVATAFVSGSMLVLSDRGVDSLEPDGPLGRIEASRFPWISIVMVLSCGFLSTVVYGVAIRLAWLHAWSPNYFAFGLAIVATASATIVVMLKARNWIHVIWVPVTVLFVLALGFSCISVRESMQIALGLVLASVFCGFFLFWMIFAGMFSTVRAPRAAFGGCGSRFGEWVARNHDWIVAWVRAPAEHAEPGRRSRARDHCARHLVCRDACSLSTVVRARCFPQSAAQRSFREFGWFAIDCARGRSGCRKRKRRGNDAQTCGKPCSGIRVDTARDRGGSTHGSRVLMCLYRREARCFQ